MNFTAELEILAEIMGGLESTGITGLLWYLGYAMLKYVISAAIILVLIYVCYKVANNLLVANKSSRRVIDIGATMGHNFQEPLYDSEFRHIMESVVEHAEYRGKYEELRLSLKDYIGRLEHLSKDYETVWADNEKKDVLITELRDEVGELEEKLALAARRLDPSVNSDYDKEADDGSTQSTPDENVVT